MKYGPSRGELWFRAGFSVAGLALLVAGISRNGVSGPAWFEIVGIGCGFFGGSLIWTLWKLWKGSGK
jgi:hypothetical protein